MMDNCLALDLGGTKLLIGIVDKSGQILFSRRSPSPLPGGRTQNEIAEYMLKCLDDFMPRASMEGVSYVGAGVVGRVDDESGIWLEIEPGRCETEELARILSRKTGLPSLIDNDVRCALRAERALGASRGLNDLIYMNIGTGIAAAFVTGGKVIKGRCFNAGEVGHVAVDVFGDVVCPCGRKGCAEAIHPKLAVIAHLQELGHAKGRYRWTYFDGLRQKARIEEAGFAARMPLWGERLA